MKSQSVITSLPTLFKRDSTGKIRQLTIEYVDGAADSITGTRSISGTVAGKLVESSWNESVAMNVGRSNETTPAQQAQKEAKSAWDKKVEGEYFEDISKVDTHDKFKPQLAHDYTKRPQSRGLSQPKLDGIRCLARADGLWTRQGKPIPTCPHIVEALAPFFEEYPDYILDGELYNHTLHDDFNKITSLVRKVKTSEEGAIACAALVEYHIYDCVNKNNADMVFLDRSEFISDQPFQTPLVIVPTTRCDTQDDLDKLYSEYTEAGYEGQMVRNDEPYDNKRSKNLLKRKEFITDEFKVVHVLEGKGNWAGYAKHFELELGDGRTFNSGLRGNQALLKELLEQEEPPTWVTCRYFELTPAGVPRFPVAIDWGVGERDD